jgi:NTP pyrophosphatase (non-canonical NTP hydrolase)
MHDERFPETQLTFAVLQREVNIWARRNFPKAEPVDPLIGLVEELGELAHAHLKRKQGIRSGPERYKIAAADAIGDIIIYLADYCATNSFDLQACVEETWERVQKRDWQKDPVAGGGEELVKTDDDGPQLELFEIERG